MELSISAIENFLAKVKDTVPKSVLCIFFNSTKNKVKKHSKLSHRFRVYLKLVKQKKKKNYKVIAIKTNTAATFKG